MKKLTAGIFAGILTIVTVNAADAAIATSGYVTEKVGAVDTKVGTLDDLNTSTKESTVAAINAVNTAVGTNKSDITQLKTDVSGNKENITILTTTVGEHATSISGLQKTVNNLTNGDGSVASQIADALAKKQNLLDNTNVKVANSTGNAVTAVTAENGTVTVTLGNFIEEKTTIGAAGHYVLTADVSETGVANYQWEKIDRATSESTGS